MASHTNNVEEDDPFGMFGDEGEDDSQITTDRSGGFYSEALVAMANRKLGAARAPGTEQSGDANEDEGRGTSLHSAGRREGESGNTGEVTLASRDPSAEVHLPWRQPRYLGPGIRLASLDAVGGGRGYAASEDLPPGTLLMIEEPLLSWPKEQLGRELGLVSVRHVMALVTLQDLHDLEHLHPTKIAVDAAIEQGVEADSGDDAYKQQVTEMLLLLRDRHKADPMLQEVLETSTRRGLVNSDGSPFTEIDCLRLFLALRYNGLQSGIYLHVAMLNHCDQPNCVKFLPTSGIKNEYSEVRTTRAVRAGEALTINYLPTILSHATRRRELWEQHRFDIGVDLPPSLRAMELVNGKLPASPLHQSLDESVTRQVEKATADLRQVYHETASLAPNLVNQDYQPTDVAIGYVTQLQAMELASQELVRGAQEQLKSDCHVLLIPCLELHLDCADQVLRTDISLSAAQRIRLCSRMVSTALQLVHLQERFLGPDHFDLARTNLDLAQAIEQLLSKSPAALTGLAVDDAWGRRLMSAAAWASREYRARKEHLRIKALYPEDGEQCLAAS